MVKSHYVKAGRLVRIARGPRQDRVAVIVDIVDANRVLVENPEDKKMWRHVQNVRNIVPLKFSVPIGRNAPSKAVKEALASSKALEKYAATRTATHIAAKNAIANATDFERYQIRVAKRSRAHWTRKIFDENDAKTPVSWHKVELKKLQKKSSKIENSAEAKKRIQKAKAKRAKTQPKKK